MTRTGIQKYLKIVDWRDESSIRVVIIVCLVVLAIMSILLRVGLVKFQTGDYVTIGSWYDFLKLHGLHGFKYAFSNYNPPITYFLYITTLLPLSKIVAIKWMLATFDIVLAISVYLIVKLFKPKNYTPYIAAIATMYLPTVFITGVFWGQFDQFYVAFLIFSLYFGLRNMSKLAWAFFGVAFAIKFQAIFFLPILGIMSFKHIRLYDAVWGFVSFLVLTLPPALVGRSIGSLLNIYPGEATNPAFSGYLTINAPNMYQWMSNAFYRYLDHAGIILTIAVTIFILLVTLIYRKFSKREILIATTLLLYVIPFLLPGMHERYFFPAGIASLVLAFTYPTATYVSLAVLMQLVTLLSYAPFLYGVSIVPLSILAIAILFIICVLFVQFFQSPKQMPNNQRQA